MKQRDIYSILFKQGQVYIFTDPQDAVVPGTCLDGVGFLSAYTILSAWLAYRKHMLYRPSGAV